MGLFKQWKDMASMERGHAENDAFWKDYFEKEKNNYEHLLENRQSRLEGTVSELAAGFGMDPVIFAGFLDGINTSLVKEIDLDTLDADTAISAEIDFNKLYWNMLDAKADWLYNLDQWDGILSQEKRAEILKEFKQSKMAVSNKVGRNDPCPCGSGKKFKKCCGQ